VGTYNGSLPGLYAYFSIWNKMVIVAAQNGLRVD
jgi:hypothetical protein